MTGLALLRSHRRSVSVGTIRGRLHGAHDGELKMCRVFLVALSHRQTTTPRILRPQHGTVLFEKVPAATWGAFFQPPPAVFLTAMTYSGHIGIAPPAATKLRLTPGRTIVIDFHLIAAGSVDVTVLDGRASEGWSTGHRLWAQTTNSCWCRQPHQRRRSRAPRECPAHIQAPRRRHQSSSA